MPIDTLTLDFEVTTSNKGNPFDQTNKAVCIGYKYNDEQTEVDFDVQRTSTGLRMDSLVIGFNLKFDLHWLRRMGSVPTGRLWCCQVAEFLIRNQCNPYPSLDDTCRTYGLSSKLDIVKSEYWEKGIDTNQVPPDILAEYCAHDVDLTYQIYLKQKELFETTHSHKYNLFRVMMADLAVLEEMEWNGMYWDSQTALKEATNAASKLTELRQGILGEYSSLPINLNSGDHLSAFLYGGTIVEEFRVPVGVYKTGIKTGLPRYKIMENRYEFPRRFEPLPKSELKKEGYFSTDESTLKQLKGKKKEKEILNLLDNYSKLEKLKGTYYEGITKLIEKKNWTPGILYGQFNQVVARTGRLSSSEPNLQNMSPEAKKLLYSRYA